MTADDDFGEGDGGLIVAAAVTVGLYLVVLAAGWVVYRVIIGG